MEAAIHCLHFVVARVRCERKLCHQRNCRSLRHPAAFDLKRIAMQVFRDSTQSAASSEFNLDCRSCKKTECSSFRVCQEN